MAPFTQTEAKSDYLLLECANLKGYNPWGAPAQGGPRALRSKSVEEFPFMITIGREIPFIDRNRWKIGECGTFAGLPALLHSPLLSQKTPSGGGGWSFAIGCDE